jgi:transcriptional regulator with XRE-family HTH domain
MNTEIIQLIDRQREIMGISKRSLASIAEITPEYYSKVLHGHADVSFSVILSLAKAVNLSIKLVLI